MNELLLPSYQKSQLQMASLFLLTPLTALQKPHLLDATIKGEEELKKRELGRERGLMTLKKK